jgi:DNA (cytosine-5)-methyltransferase 1
MRTRNKKITALDLFAGCGGLTEGFEMSGHYETAACVEWEKSSRDTLANRLKTKWGYKDGEERVLQFDVQRTSELLKGWLNDSDYGSSLGLQKLIEKQGKGIDLIVGGPPCQAYSIAGRVRDEHGMNNDYRNFLFETYIKLVAHYQPKAIIFENVPGMLSARPGGVEIIERVKESFKKVGYSLIDDVRKYAIVDASDYGVPQSRKRLILLGIRDGSFEGNPQELLKEFYTEVLPSFKKSKMTVAEAVFDLPKLLPNPDKKQRAKLSHVPQNTSILNHKPRFHSERDIAIFRELALDATRKNKKYKSIEALKKLYTKMTGKVSSIHKYYVLERDKQSNTIVSHLHKDGLRHIHPDPEQARSITVREAARLQSFPDDFEFLGSVGDQYKMVGNAVPPNLARAVAESVASFLEDNLIQTSEIISTPWTLSLKK